MKIIDLFEENDDLDIPDGHAMGHGRLEDLEYKEKKVKGVVDRVIVSLEGRESAVWTRMANRYRKIKNLIESLSKKRDELNVQLKDELVQIFDAEDEVLTRVVETVSMTVTLGKKETRTSAAKFHTKPFLKDLYSLAEELSNTLPELAEKIREIEEKHTELGKPVEVSPKLGVKLKDSVNEGIADQVMKFARTFGNWLLSFDRKLNSIKRRIRRLN